MLNPVRILLYLAPSMLIHELNFSFAYSLKHSTIHGKPFYVFPNDGSKEVFSDNFRQSYGEEDPRSSGSIIRGASSTRQWSVENSDENDTPDDCRISDDDRGCSVM